jgi:hypothetical protein
VAQIISDLAPAQGGFFGAIMASVKRQTLSITHAIKSVVKNEARPFRIEIF